MKLATVFSTIALALLLAITVPTYAQDESRPQEEKRAEPDGKAAHDQDRQQDKREDRDKQDKKEEKQADRDHHDEQGNHPAEAREGHEGRPGGHIPDDRFRASFGRQHTFTIGHPVIVSGSPRFQYGGYWFVIAQPWPVGWAYTDVVYVDYIDGGYFLLSPVHPGVQIAINVIL